ncbi:ABC transporter substrate-binding protein [Halarchaeum nitratireducens]|uniref:Uncharacterized protein n=1 Tax=Halarchaeum nitratireducens TaxID=489913 RepID=A0A830G7Z3_9EURY|nr:MULTISPECIES: hypothetical protein [Halarchaeum]MBP2249938.1 ABC-type nitrate/sulfonate/bicarbonate transport system substrate-binding protein [Halarchaeum solikamskense]GGN09654.1 hypothetical protein GCM10009021_06560 [Halarchaeum nitratireducens]
MRRRAYLRTGAAVIGSTGIAGLAGCGGSGGGGDGGTLRLAFQAPAETVDVNTWDAADRVAPAEYDLDTSIDVFEGVDLAAQSVLSGNADVARGSVTAAANLVAAGREFTFVSVPIRSTDYVLVTDGEIDSLEAIVEQDAVIGMSAPNGLDAVQTIALLSEEGVIESADELNFQRVGYSSARRAALAEGSIDVSPQHYAQWLAMREEGDGLTRLATFGDVLTSWIQETYMVPQSVIDEKRPQLVDFVAAQLLANRRLADDYERYGTLIDEYVDGGGPEERVQRRTYDFLTDVDVWPPGGGLGRDEVDYMLDLSARVGLTDERIPTDDVMDRSILDDALARVGAR